MMPRPVLDSARLWLIVLFVASSAIVSAQATAPRRPVRHIGNAATSRNIDVPVSPGNWSQLAKFTQFRDNNFCCNSFGTSVGISGDTIVVGDPDYWTSGQGAYLFLKPGDGWHNALRSAVLKVDGTSPHDYFNVPVAIDRDTIVVGGDGAAYVYVKPASGWTTMSPTATLTALGGVLGDKFGNAVALEGNTIVITASGKNSGAGGAYVFVKPAAGWRDMTETAELTASDAQPSESLGRSASINGKTIALGAQLYPNPGKAYVFVEGAGGWSDMTETAELTGSDTVSGSSFGFSISVSDDVVLVGDFPILQGAGKAYLFVRPAGGWTNMTETAALTAADGQTDDEFGTAVLIRGKMAVVGAQGRGRVPNRVAGGVYVFNQPSGGWRDMASTTVLTGSDARHFAQFGSAVALSGNELVIGAAGQGFHSAFVFGQP